MTVMGLDIGYSNVGIVSGDPGRAVGHCLPAGAGLLADMPKGLAGERSAGIPVVIDGVQWMAGVEPYRLQRGSRDLHADYCSTDSYRALFHAALARAGHSQIDRLVTGLPVSHYLDEARRQRLAAQLEGAHDIGSGLHVQVGRVSVVPQPAGGYMDWVENATDQSIIERGRILVVDPGYYSVDWVVIEAGEMHQHSSGSSTQAMSTLIELADQMLFDRYETRCGADRIERDIRAGRESLLVNGHSVPLFDLIQGAADVVAPRALRELRQSLRSDLAGIDMILLTGGGARFYRAAAETVFPDTRVTMLDDSVMGNARGYWNMGQ